MVGWRTWPKVRRSGFNNPIGERGKRSRSPDHSLSSCRNQSVSISISIRYTSRLNPLCQPQGSSCALSPQQRNPGRQQLQQRSQRLRRVPSLQLSYLSIHPRRVRSRTLTWNTISSTHHDVQFPPGFTNGHGGGGSQDCSTPIRFSARIRLAIPLGQLRFPVNLMMIVSLPLIMMLMKVY
jgi:hypothetical protein